MHVLDEVLGGARRPRVLADPRLQRGEEGVVAELGPPAPGRSPVLADARLAEAVRRGWIAAPARTGVVPPRQPVLTMAELLAGLEADRADR